MTITKYITYPQRLLPVAFAAYWLVRSEFLSLSGFLLQGLGVSLD